MDQNSVAETSATDERNKNIETSLQLYVYMKTKTRKWSPKKRDGQRKTEQKVFFLSRREDDCNDDNDFTTLI